MGIFTKYQNLSCEKSLTQQFNALNQEMDLLRMQLEKVNQLLNDTITEKCKHELVYHQQIQNTQNKTTQSSQQQQMNDTSTLFRASLINPVSQTSNESKSNSSVWKFSSPNVLTKQALNQSNSQFSSTDNLLNQSGGSRPNNTKNNYQPHHHHYYLNTKNAKLAENNVISKSIDSIYSPASSTGSSNKMNTSQNGFSAFNSINGKKLTIQSQNQDSSDEHNKSDSFQPVNFTNSIPRQLNISIQQPNHNTAFVPTKSSNFKRDVIAEKKRSSIGKYPHNYFVSLFFFLILIFSLLRVVNKLKIERTINLKILSKKIHC